MSARKARSKAAELTEAGATKVARFSRRLWIVGGGAVLVIAAVATPTIWFDRQSDEVIVEQNEWRAGGDFSASDGRPPWEAAGANDAEFEDGRWYGNGPARIVLDGLRPGEPLLVTSPNALLRPQRAWVFDSRETPGDAASDPVNLRTFRPENYWVPASSELILWVAPGTDRRWELTIVEATLPERSGLIEGSGPAAFRYRGDATVARVTLEPGPENQLRVFGESEEAVTNFFEGNSERTVSWPDAGPGGVVIVVDTDEPDDAWSLQMQDQEATVGYGGTGNQR